MRTVHIDGVACEVPDDTSPELVAEVERWYHDYGRVSFSQMDNAGIKIPQELKEKYSRRGWGSEIFALLRYMGVRLDE